MMNFIMRTGWLRGQPVSEAGIDPCTDRISHSSVPFEDLRIGARGQVGVGKPVMDRPFCRGDDRADRTGVVAERDGEIERYTLKRIERFWLVAGDIDPDLLHHLNRTGTYPPGWAESGREDLVPVAVFRLEVTFRHLGTGGVCGADKEDAESAGHSPHSEDGLQSLYHFC